MSQNIQENLLPILVDLYVFLCARAPACMRVQVCAHVEVRGQAQVSFLSNHPTGLSLPWSSLSQLAWPEFDSPMLCVTTPSFAPRTWELY